MLPAARELLHALSPVLSRWGRWYLFGAQAVVVYGVPRLSADVDVTVALSPETPERFARDMETAGFVLRVADPDFIRRTRVMPFTHRTTGMPLDVVLAASGLEDEFLSRAVPTNIDGTMIPLIHIEDLLVAKILAARPKDIEDAKALWNLHGNTLDLGRMRELLEALEEALDQSDLIATLDAVVAGETR